jgi:hypothetical protein
LAAKTQLCGLLIAGQFNLPGALDSPVGGKTRKHTISIYMYLRSYGEVNREEKPSSRRFLEPYDSEPCVR